MRETLGSLMKSHKYQRIEQDDAGKASILGVPMYTLCGDTLGINDINYELTPEIHKALPSTGYTRRSKKKDSYIFLCNLNRFYYY